jgi:hypothetical protein
MVFFPVAAQIRNPRAAIATISGLIVIAVAASQLLDLLLEDPLEAKRFTFEEIAYGKSSASGRVTNILTLVKAWLSNPVAPLSGLGLGAFAYYSESAGEPYSHVLFADAVFELGLPGAVLMSVIVWTSARAALGTLRAGSASATMRASAALVVAWWLYELLLANKQGALWGVASLFPASAIMARLAAFACNAPNGEPAMLDPLPDSGMATIGKPSDAGDLRSAGT